MSNNIEDTLKERGSRYGGIEGNSNVTQELMKTLEAWGENFGQLSNVHKECIHMIFHKISRMVSGDVDYIDNVHDIVGYAQLLENYLIKKEEDNKSINDPYREVRDVQRNT